jgi:RNA polymerase sigma factor (sigma-70 family)
MFEILKNTRRKNNRTGTRLDTTQQNELMRLISQAEDFSHVRQEFELLYDSVVYPLWASLSKKYIPPLSKDDLKDVFQEAWIKILESRKKYDSRHNAFNWIYIIKQNLILDKIRKFSHSKVIDTVNVDQDDSLSLIPDDQPIVEAAIITEETNRLILKAIDDIGDDTEREILIRRVVKGQKLEEISKAMDIPLTTVYKKVKKCIEALKPKITDILNN